MRSIYVRALLVTLLFAVLFGLFVGYGTLEPDPSENRFPTNGDLAAGHLSPGDQLLIAGEVHTVQPDRTTIALSGYPDVLVDLTTLDGDPVPGDDVWVYGTLTEAGPDGHTVDTHRTIVRAPWEIGYMYAISLLAGFWVLARFVRGWRLSYSGKEIGFVPKRDAGTADADVGGDRRG